SVITAASIPNRIGDRRVPILSFFCRRQNDLEPPSNVSSSGSMGPYAERVPIAGFQLTTRWNGVPSAEPPRLLPIIAALMSLFSVAGTLTHVVPLFDQRLQLLPVN